MSEQNMVEIAVGDATGAVLDWMVAKAIGLHVEFGQLSKPLFFGTYWVDEFHGPQPYEPSTSWAQGGPLIEEHVVTFIGASGVKNGVWYTNLIAGVGKSKSITGKPVSACGHALKGEGHLVAAMRAIVAAKLGDRISVPAELVEQP